MRGDSNLIDYLNPYLQIELTGHKQYLPAAAMCGLRTAVVCSAEHEESPLQWLKSQLTLMDQVGLENYLAEQIRT